MKRAHAELRQLRVKAGLVTGLSLDELLVLRDDVGRTRCWTLEPESFLRIFQDFLCMSAIMCEIFVVPFSVAFGVAIPAWYEIAFVALFSADILLNFCTGFFFHGLVIHKPTLIAYNYMTHFFLLDFIATFPWDILVVSVMPYGPQALRGVVKGSRFFRSVRLVRLIRIIKLSHIVQKMMKYLKLINS